MKLYNTFKSLILEIASVDSIVDAIKKRDKIIIYYDGDEPGRRGLRLIEPVCFGYSKADNPVVRAWDSQGASHTAYLGEQPLPGWRLFRADKIFSFKPTGETFNEPKPNYNPNGDKSMNRVIINADFSEVTPQQAPEPTTPETEVEVNDVIDDVIITTVNDMINNIIEKDGTEIARTFHRHVLSPGDSIVNEDPKVQAIANAVWTEEVIAAYQASLVSES